MALLRPAEVVAGRCALCRSDRPPLTIGRRWTELEDLLLLDVANGRPLTSRRIAHLFRRSPGAIRVRLAQIGDRPSSWETAARRRVG